MKKEYIPQCSLTNSCKWYDAEGDCTSCDGKICERFEDKYAKRFVMSEIEENIFTAFSEVCAELAVFDCSMRVYKLGRSTAFVKDDKLVSIFDANKSLVAGES